MHDRTQAPAGRPHRVAMNPLAAKLREMAKAGELDAAIRRNLEALRYGA